MGNPWLCAPCFPHGKNNTAFAVLVVGFVSISSLAISLTLRLSLGHNPWTCLHQLLPLLAIALLYAENLLALCLRGLLLTLASIALFGVSVATLELLALVLLLLSSAEVVVRFAIFLELVVEFFDGSRFFSG